MKKTIPFLLIALFAAACSTEKDYLVTFSTPYGDMHAVLYDATPKHKRNFLKLAESGQYDSLLFHRVIADFMIQSGDLATRPGASPADAVEYTVPAEFVDTLFHRKGALAAARQGDQLNPERASSGSQFYIVQGKQYNESELTVDMDKLSKGVEQLVQFVDYVDEREKLIALYESGDYEGYTQAMIDLKPAVEEKLDINVDRPYPAERRQAYTTVGGVPHLDDTYTVFGQVVDNLNLIDSVARQPTGQADKPIKNIYLTVSVEEMSKKKITKRYGYTYPAH